MKIFITGTAGFIGFSLAKSLLENDHSVYGYDGITNYYDVKLKNNRNKILKKYKKFSFTKGMLENRNLLDKTIIKFKPEIIIHLAAQAGVRYSIDKPRTYLSSNIIGTHNIIELAHKVKVKHLMIASSSSVYGANKKTPYSENDSVKLQMSIYASTKLATETIAHSYSHIWNTPTTVLRFFTVYGPWGRPDMALFKFTKSILEGKKIDIYNKGNLYRDFTYISDIVDFIDAIIRKKENKKFEILNLGSDNPIKLKLFIELIEKKLKKQASKNYIGKQSGDMHGTHADMKKSLKNYNLKSKIDLRAGINKFIDWYIDYNKSKKY